MFADLHLHTNFSDGTYTPEELAGEARRHGVGCVALTDHDTMDGCPRMAVACEAAGLEFIPGSELTAEVDGHELHLLGYYLDAENQALTAKLAQFQVVRQNRIHEMAALLNQRGIPLRVEKVFELADCRSPGRPHVARALVQAGVCASVDEAFERFLKKDKPAWVPKFKISAAEAIQLIHGAAGLAALAHPGLNRIDESIPSLVEAGLDGIECFHTKHTRSVAEHYQGVAKAHGLLVTGGSDCHGMSKGKPLLGSVKLPYEYVERMKDRVIQRVVDSGFKIARGSDPGPPS